ncbi:MAG: PaaI family thioesterase [Bacteroidota bacterium]
MDLANLHKFRDLAVQGKWKEIENMFNKSVQLKHQNILIDLTEPMQPVAFIPELKDIHQGGIGTSAANGGTISMLADVALGLLGLSYYKDGMTATAQLTIHYLKPLHGKSLKAVAGLQQVVGNRVFGMVNILNDKNEICAVAYGALAKGISM